ncbi:substrate-binding domain-containing protein [Leucobacter weissii]|uniref:Substrate-binding domain-containing protein n=1 Tax=Leucobacter weissii TaxID=1983706 RepID=A0A939SBH0_9MICO|nr:substrate-binding domain-containing protein [Leucobacter weissii]MBO1901435.1 substrate-binding domain-containing protein [Leucobacter weissii]
MKRRTSRLVSSAAIAALACGVAGCAPTAEQSDGGAPDGGSAVADEAVQYGNGQEVIDSYDITELCGEEEITLAFPVGIANPWMKAVHMLMQQEAEKCDNIGVIEMIDAQVDQQKAVSDVNSLVAQGVDGIVTLPIFGEAQVPSFRAAMDADVPVVTFVADSGGVVGQDVAAHVSQDYVSYAAGWADWLGEHLEEGTVVFLGNAPGQPSSVAAFEAFEETIAEYPGITLVEDEYQVTNNSAVEKKRVMTGLLAKHGRIDAVVTDAGAYDLAVLEAYEEADLELPYLANANTTNGVGCAWQEQKFPLFSWDGSQTHGVVALRHLVSAVTGSPTTEPVIVKPFVAIDTFADKAPRCESDMSPDVDWSVPLSDEDLKTVHG